MDAHGSYISSGRCTKIYVPSSNPFYQKWEKPRDILYLFTRNGEKSRVFRLASLTQQGVAYRVRRTRHFSTENKPTRLLGSEETLPVTDAFPVAEKRPR